MLHCYMAFGIGLRFRWTIETKQVEVSVLPPELGGVLRLYTTRPPFGHRPNGDRLELVNYLKMSFLHQPVGLRLHVGIR